MILKQNEENRWWKVYEWTKESGFLKNECWFIWTKKVFEHHEKKSVVNDFSASQIPQQSLLEK